MSPRIPDHVDGGLLGLYLSDHYTGATAGLSRAKRMAESYADTDFAEDLARFAKQLESERGVLRGMIETLGVRQRPHRQALAWAGEHVGRLKLNGRVFSRSPMSVLLEIELIRGAVMGKLGGWQTLTELATELGLDPEPFSQLADQSLEQVAMLDLLHGDARANAFRKGNDVG